MTSKDPSAEKMKPTTSEELQQAVDAAFRHWPSVGGDTNLYDVYVLGQKIREGLGVALPTELPAKSAGVQVFECVETNLLRGLLGRGLIRETPVAEVARRVVNLHGALKGLLPFSDDQNLVVSLYAWHGCIHMGKLLRCTYNVAGGQALYTPQDRRNGYAQIRDELERDAAAGNPWVRYGVSLARPMEQGRKGADFDCEVHENWIPRASPYWEE